MSNSCPDGSIQKDLTICFKSEEDAKKKLQSIIGFIKKHHLKKQTLNCDKQKKTECSKSNRECNPKTNRCVKKKTQKNVKKRTIKKATLKAKHNCDKQTQDKCAKKYKKCNPKTNRCVKKKTKQTKKATIKKLLTKSLTKSLTKTLTKTEQIPDKTPQYNKNLRSGLTKLNVGSKYSPSINRDLKTLKSLSPTGTQGCLKLDDIKDEKTNKCYGWGTKKARDIMLRNLVSKKPIDCETITAPKQLLSNCWFNSFFVTFFISDKGRKFNRWLREAMITGVMANGQPVPKELKKPLFLLNKYIDASLHSKRNKTDFASLMNTNNIIKMVHRAIGKKINVNGTLVAKVDVPSNPFSFYNGVYGYLGGDLMHWIKIQVNSDNLDLEWLKYKVSQNATQDGTPSHPLMPKVVFLEIFDDESEIFQKPLGFTVNSIKNGENIKCKYVLDSAILRNTEKFHFSAYLTCNDNDFSFDGESFSRMSPFPWKSKINQNIEWQTSKYDTLFNFQKGYQILIYYLDEVIN